MIRLTPLGGFGETGALNCLLYETDQTAMIVDCGVAFADDQMPGVNLVIPDFSLIHKIKAKLKAVVLTHGHEDHVGALPYFLREFDVPVYAMEFTRGLVRGKLEEFQMLATEVRDFVYDQKFKIGDFEIDPIFINHSIMDAAALLISAHGTNILHCTDFKIDHGAPDGRVTDLVRFKKIGEEGLHWLLLDSTNALSKGWTLSESNVRANLIELFTKRKTRIITCLFASNTYRLQSLIECARLTGRKIALTGRSAKEYFRVAMSLERMDLKDVEIYDVEDIHQFDDSQILLVVTGSQAEPRSVLSRISQNMFGPFKIKPNDTIVMSSRMIPGNEGRIMAMMDRLALLGAEIITPNSENQIHASGHAYEDELREVIRITKPRHFLPIHGEYRYLKRHNEIAHEEGVPEKNCVLLLDGETLETEKDDFGVVALTELNLKYISENSDIEMSPQAVRRRQKLAWNGLVTVSVIYDHAESRVQRPVLLHSEGLFGGETEANLLADLTEYLNAILKKHAGMRFDKVQKFFKTEVRHHYKAQCQIRPEVVVLVHEV